MKWEGLDTRSSGYDSKYYTFAGNSTWLSGKGGYTSNIDYVLDYKFKKTTAAATGKIVRKCILGCSYNNNINKVPNAPSGSLNILFGGGYSGYVSDHDYIMYTKDMRVDLSVTVGSEQEL